MLNARNREKSLPPTTALLRAVDMERNEKVRGRQEVARVSIDGNPALLGPSTTGKLKAVGQGGFDSVIGIFRKSGAVLVYARLVQLKIMLTFSSRL